MLLLIASLVFSWPAFSRVLAASGLVLTRSSTHLRPQRTLGQPTCGKVTMRFRARISLLSMLLLIGLICVSISHVLLSYKTNLLQHENQRQAAELGYLVIEDPNKAYIRQVATPSPGVFKYRVHLPSGRRYVLRQADSWYGTDFPNTTPLCQLFEPGDPSEFLLTISLRDQEGDLHYFIRGSRAIVGRTLSGLGRPVEQIGLSIPDVQHEFDGEEPMEVVRLPLGQSSQTRAETGLRLWISPLSDEEASKLGPPTRDGTYVASAPDADVKPEREAGRLVQRLGGSTTFDDQGYLTGVTLQYVPVVDEEIRFLSNLSRIKRLFIYKTQVTDAGLDVIRDLSSLRDLSLCQSDISDAGLANLNELNDLRNLRLWSTRITDKGLDHVRNMTEMRELGLTTNQITDKGLACLEKMTKLRALYLGNTKVAGPGLKYLAKMKHLRQLYLGNTQVNDEGLMHLEELPDLDTLYLDGSRVSDAGLVHVGQLAKLSVLNLARCAVTDKGLGALSSLHYLNDLVLNDTPVTSEGLRVLVNLKQLRRLSLDGTELGDEAVPVLLELPHIGRLDVADTRLSDAAVSQLVAERPGLEINRLDRLQKQAADEIGRRGPSSFWADGRNVTGVKLSGPNVTNVDLKHLDRLKHIETLEIRGTVLTDFALERLRSLPQLRTLKLSGMGVTDAWLEKLAQLQIPISELELSDLPITDAGLEYVAALPQLVRLEISDSQVTDLGLLHLAEHPQLEVYLTRTRTTAAGVKALLKTVRYAESN